MKAIRTLLLGLGAVNIGFLKILINKRAVIKDKYGLDFKIVGVSDSSGVALDGDGFDYQTLIDLKSEGGAVQSLTQYLPETNSVFMSNHTHADLLIDASPVNLENGSPGLPAVLNAMENGCHVVLANKAPLVLEFDKIHSLAAKRNITVAYSATVCGGLPLINILQRDLKTASLMSFQGILNATSNFILKELESGGAFEEAVREAQRVGAAEADPSLDIEGYDTANKLFIIMKSFTDFDGKISDIKVTGIQDIDKDYVIKQRLENKKVKLVAMAKPDGPGWDLEVRPVSLPVDSFLASCNGWEMGVEFETDLYDKISIRKFEEDPQGTSAAVLRDAIDVFN